jgi:uncharacterized protein YhaN
MTPLAFQELTLRKLPGFERQGFSIDRTRIGDGLNLIYGPNASGKTSTARAIEALLWPESPEAKACLLSADIRLGETPWSIDLEGGRAVYRQDGVSCAAPALPPFSHRDRYRLSLPELLKAHGADFAGIIQQEVSGGYDLTAASQTLGYRPRGPARAAETKQLADVHQAVQKLRSAARALQEEESQLSILQQERELALKAATDQQELTRAIDWRQAREQSRAAARHLQAFPGFLAKFKGNEQERLQQLQEARQKTVRDLAHQNQVRGQAQREKQETGLGQGLAPGTIASLRTSLQRLQALESEADRLQREVVGSTQTQNNLLRRFGRLLPDALPPRLNQETLAEFGDLVRLAESWRTETKTLQTSLGLLPTPSPADLASSAQLLQASDLLQQWRKRHQFEASARPWRLALSFAGVIIGLEGLLLALTQQRWFGVGVGLGIAFVIWAWRFRGKHGQVRQAYEETGVAAPQVWTDAAVANRFEELQRELQNARESEHARIRRRELETQLRLLEQQGRELTARREELCQSIGGFQNLDEISATVMADNLSRVLAARAQSEAHQAELRETRAQIAKVLLHINQTLEAYGQDPIRDAAAATGAMSVLADREACFVQAEQNERHAAEHAVRLGETLAGLEHDLQSFFERLGLSADSEGETSLLDACRQWPDYEQARRARDLADHDLARTESALADRPALKEASLQDLERQRQECRQAAERLDEINREITRIETLVGKARRSRDLEQARAREQDAADNLCELRRRSEQAIAGHCLLGFLRRRNRHRQLPPVFHRAHELFLEMTRGRYELELGDDEKPCFLARDTICDRLQPLAELSSATRLQLLLAVRVAFVETLETDLKLPLILDEVLGNSDDERTEAIIRGLAAIARTGRQIFYCTAQHSDIGKWQTVLGEAATSSLTVIDLLHCRHLTQARPPHFPATAPPQAPAPGQASRAEYGQILGVGALDPRSEHTGQIHLWHLLEDPQVLYRALCHGISRWGQLESLLNHAPQVVPDMLQTEPPVLERAAALARTIGEASRLWRLGRGRPVDGEQLRNSGIFSERFLDRVCQLADTCEGDAESLLAELEQGAVPRLRRDTCQKLGEFLVDAGHLDPSTPLTPEQIQVKTYAFAARFIADGILQTTDLANILSCEIPRKPTINCLA